MTLIAAEYIYFAVLDGWEDVVLLGCKNLDLRAKISNEIMPDNDIFGY
jgi:hypothetical protein